MAKSKLKIIARKLRRQGESIKVIASKLDVSVGSVSLWCRDILLSDEQIKNLQKRSIDPFYGKKLEYLQRKRDEFNTKVNNLRKQGIREVGSLSKRDRFLLGIALYWGEGFKKDHQVGFATSDIHMANFFIKWLSACFGIPSGDLILRVTANIHYQKNINQIENYWSTNLNISLSNFSRPFFQKVKLKKKYENESGYHGVLRIKVRRSIDLLRKIQGYIEGVSENIKKTHSAIGSS
jgi:hypothetical protein